MIRQLTFAIVVFLLSGCSYAQVNNLPDGYLNCTHKYDARLDVLVKSEEDIVFIQPNSCSAAIQNSLGECPTLVRVVNIDDKIVWLTSLQYENYVCKTIGATNET